MCNATHLPPQTVTPVAPQAGDTVTVNLTASLPNAVNGGNGAIVRETREGLPASGCLTASCPPALPSPLQIAFLYDLPVFATNITTCGLGQQIDM